MGSSNQQQLKWEMFHEVPAKGTHHIVALPPIANSNQQ
jgi:hypothetical protein